MKTKRAVLGFCCLLLIAGCSPINVRFAYDTGADLTKLKTYDWLPLPATIEGTRVAANQVDQVVRDEVDRQLLLEGLSRDLRSPDFLVTYHIAVEDKIDVDDWGYSYAARKRYYTAEGFGVVDVVQYEKGTLVLDFVDPSTKKLIWRGEAQAGLDPKRTTEKADKIVEKALKRILEKYPPPKPN